MPYREKRASERISCNLEASVISDASIYDGFIKNLSEDGLEFRSAPASNLPRGVDPPGIIRLLFSIFSDEVIRLVCIPRWYAEVLSHDQVRVGMKIINPPVRYSELIRNIHLCKYL